MRNGFFVFHFHKIPMAPTIELLSGTGHPLIHLEVIPTDGGDLEHMGTTKSSLGGPS